jgi:MFS family permease
MRTFTKAGITGALALAMVSTAVVSEANADRRGRIVGGVVAGLVIGGLIAGAATAGPRYYSAPRYYAAPPRSACGDLRRRAIYNEEIGRPDRARHWWDRYEDCRGG